MTSKHYDELRDQRVTSKDELVMGRTYLVCHVPLDNPFTGGVEPFCSRKAVVDLQFLSYNDIHTAGREHLYDDHEALARIKESDVLNRKSWMFKTRRISSVFGRVHESWDHCETYVQPEGETPYNYILDLAALSEEGIEVIETPSVEYVISDELREQREWEQLAEQTYYYTRD